VKLPFDETVSVSVPLSTRTAEPPLGIPEIVPPMVKGPAVALQATATLVTFAVAVPVPPVTEHVSFGGGVVTVTAYAPPLAIFVPKVKLPFAETVKESVPLLDRITDVPLARPETVPPIVKVWFCCVVPMLPPPHAASDTSATAVIINRGIRVLILFLQPEGKVRANQSRSVFVF